MNSVIFIRHTINLERNARTDEGGMMSDVLTWYAGAVTIIALLCGIGWYLAHDVLRGIADCEDGDLPFIRNLLRERYGKKA